MSDDGGFGLGSLALIAALGVGGYLAWQYLMGGGLAGGTTLVLTTTGYDGVRWDGHVILRTDGLPMAGERIMLQHYDSVLQDWAGEGFYFTDANGEAAPYLLNVASGTILRVYYAAGDIASNAITV